MTLAQTKKQLTEWLNAFRFNFDYELVQEGIERGQLLIRIRFYTFTNKYTVVAYAPGDTTKGYLGCVANTRKPRAGEDWTRGRDLADGPFGRETWDKILVDIVAYETVKIHRQAATEGVDKVVVGPSIEPTG